MYRVFSGGFSVTKVKCYVSVQVTYLLDINVLNIFTVDQQNHHLLGDTYCPFLLSDLSPCCLLTTSRVAVEVK